jgi:CBS domain-containing protein
MMVAPAFVPDALAAPVRSAMRSIVSALSPQTSIAAAARLFSEQRISGAPVLDEEGRLVGVVSQRDLLRGSKDAPPPQGSADYYLLFDGVGQPHAEVRGAEEDGRGRVGDVMTRHIVAVAPDTSLRDAVRRMLEERIHRVLVVEDGHLLGIVSTVDVLRALVPVPVPSSSSSMPEG